MRIRLLGLLFAGTLTCVSATAHDLWLEHQTDAYLLYRGHHHTDQAADELEPYDSDFVLHGVCAEPDGVLKALEAAPGYPARFPTQCTALLVTTSSGVWSKTVQGTKHRHPGELSGVVRSWRSLESVKRVDAWNPTLSKPLGQDLELVPLNDPLALQVGDELHLLVTYKGQPRPGVTVAYDDDVQGVTNADGRIDLRIPQAGMQLISGTYNEPDETGEVDLLQQGAVLQFELDGSNPP